MRVESMTGMLAMSARSCLMAAAALGVVSALAPTCVDRRNAGVVGECVEFATAAEMRSTLESIVAAQAAHLEAAFMRAGELSGEQRSTCKYVESCDPTAKFVEWQAAKFDSQFADPDTRTCSRRDWGDGSQPGNPRAPVTITGRSIRTGATDSQCTGYTGLGGKDGVTPNALLSDPYYTLSGCFDANIETKCTVNTGAYGLNLPTNSIMTAESAAQREVCATNELVGLPNKGFEAVARKYPQITWSFLGMQETGLFRNWPLIYQCRTEQQCSGCSDPRFRGWYASASSGPKDVVLVIDRSGSMVSSGRFALAKEAAMWVINTLSYVDYATIVTFSTSADVSYGGAMLRMTGVNKARLKKYVAGMSGFGGTRLDLGFEKAMSVLRTGKKEGKTTGCQSVVLFMTDGRNTGKNPAPIVREANRGLGAHVFTYHFGNKDDKQGMKLMKQIACENNGVYFSVSQQNGGNLKVTMASYFK